MKTPTHPSASMKTVAMTALAALVIAAPSALIRAPDQTAPTTPPPAGQCEHHGGPHLLPPGAVQALNLTEDQKKQIADLEADVKSKMKNILTPEQLEQLKQMHPKGGGGHQGGGAGNQQQTPPPAQQ